jgi:hypothetical protein
VNATETLPRLTIRDLVQPEKMVRAPGVHVSDLVKEVMLRIDPERYGREMDKADSENWQEAGFLWEDMVTRAFVRARREKGNLIRGSEISLDGVSGNPDWLEWDDDPFSDLWLSETKATWKSASEFDAGVESALYSKKFVGYTIQVMAYAHMLHIPRVRLHILFMNGNYQRYVPEVRSYSIRFTAQELEDNWRQLINMGRKKGWL